ncbi:MAG: Spy/CpxP family protein refolding chaperone [Acidobacteria bacterium]|nr:Spy/CpxP family protein refolding chaperone [Acidobacteriota bacterium]
MKIKTLSLAALLCAGGLFAQRGPFGGGPRPGVFPVDQLKEYLGLSDQQLQDLKRVQSSLRDASEPLMQQIAEKMKSLRETLRQDPNADVSRLKSDIAKLQSDVQSLRAQYKTQALGYLTGDQTAKLAALKKAFELMPAAHQAVGLNLLDPPAGVPRGGVGPQFRGPGGMAGPGIGAPPRQ